MAWSGRIPDLDREPPVGAGRIPTLHGSTTHGERASDERVVLHASASGEMVERPTGAPIAYRA